MTLLLGAIGWGLFAAGAATHLGHFARLQELLSAHTEHARHAGQLLVAVELLIAVGVPIAFFAGWSSALTAMALAAGLIGVGFTAWVLRLYLSKSTLPCACSFSSAPTTIWSVLRSGATILVACLALASATSWGDDLATLTSGAAIAMTLFVLPDALAWPAFATDMRDYSRRANASSQAAS